MQMSKEIIEILDYLCKKFGVAIDWTSGNIMPYLEELSDKLVRYEITTSIIWIIISAIIIIPSIIFSVKVIKNKEYDCDCKCSIMLILISLALGFAVVLIVQIFDIAEYCIIPEKYLLEYISALARKVG